MNRAKKEHNVPPCQTDKKLVFKSIKDSRDTEPKQGALPYTKEMIDKATKRTCRRLARSSSYAPILFSNTSNLQRGVCLAVPITNFTLGNDIEQQIVATNDLSGCTVLIVASPFAVIMIHVLERRDNTIVDALGNPGWAINPTGPLQQAQDVQVAERGQFLLNYELAQFNLDRTTGQPCIPTIVNEYCGWFPETTTFEHVVGPAANPDYDLPTSRYGNPWYVKPDQNPNLATENPMRLLYKQAADLLKTMAVISVIPNRPNAAFLWSYRRRSSDDPIRTSRTDDTEFIILKPQIMSDLSVWTTMSWDDTKLALIAKMV